MGNTETGAPGAAHAQTDWHPGALRKVVFALAFLLLLPFWASLPMMLYQRLAKGVLFDAWGIIVMAVALTVVMALVVCELLFSLRARIELGETAVRYTLPPRGVLPLLSYRSAIVPYAEIASVETRREIYGGAIAPVMVRGARILTRDGSTHSLGYVSEAEVDPVFPVRDIASTIARNAGVELIDRGSVRRLAGRKLLGLRAAGDDAAPITDEDVARLNARHRRVVLGLVGIMLALLVAGIGVDLSSGDVDRGERARDAVQRSAVPAAKR